MLNNEYGIRLWHSDNNTLYHNNFIENLIQVNDTIREWLYPWQYYYHYSKNIWDNSYPSGGNYWSDYTGVDVDGNGIGDTPYVIDVNNTDRYPLIAPITTFDADVWNGTAYHVDIISNSSLSNFNIDTSRKTVSFNVTGEENQTGFCRITIPNVIVEDLWHGNYTVLLNGETWPYRNWTDTANTYIYLNYTHSEHQIVIIPEFPSSIALLGFLMLITIPLILVKKGQQTRKANERT